MDSRSTSDSVFHAWASEMPRMRSMTMTARLLRTKAQWTRGTGMEVFSERNFSVAASVR